MPDFSGFSGFNCGPSKALNRKKAAGCRLKFPNHPWFGDFLISRIMLILRCLATASAFPPNTKSNLQPVAFAWIGAN